MEAIWYRTNEYGEVRDAMRAILEFSLKLPEDLTYWKWIVIALHNAVQGCMVIALTHSDGTGAINEKDAILWRRACEAGGPYPKRERLLTFSELYTKIKLPMAIEYSSAWFTSNKIQDQAFRKLNELRNEFIHFTPKGWSLEISGLPEICLECLKVCKFLVGASGKFRIFSDYKEGELNVLISQIESKFSVRV